MGCFSVSCGLSNLSIYFEDIAIMLLKKNKYVDEIDFDKNFICSNEGAKAFFEPCSPLIFGSCDTYGNIEDIELTEAFNWTCESLGIKNTEEDFHEYISKDWMDTPEDGIYVTFFNKNIVKKAIEFQRKEDSLFNYLEQDWVLKQFPNIFILSDKKDNDRYKYVYTIKNSDKIIKSDGGFINIDKNGVYTTEKLLEIINNKEISDEILAYNAPTYIELLYDKEIKNAKDNFRMFDESFGLNRYLGTFKNSENIKKEVCDIYLLSNFMYKCNRYFAPVFSGMQCNDFISLSYLNKISKEEIDNIRKEYN